MSSEVRAGVTLTSLDQSLFDGAGVTKRDLVDYLDAMADRIVPVLADRALSVIRARPGQKPFMQKNVPSSAPPWLRRVTWWAESSQRDVSYAVCDDRASLLWLANQRAVEYHPTLVTASRPDHMTHLVVDLDPPEGAPFAMVAAVAALVRRTLLAAGLDGVAKTSGSKGIHVFVPVDDGVPIDDAAAALRALAARVAGQDPTIATTAFLKDDRGDRVYVDPTRVGGATVAAAYSPRARPGLPVSFPIAWEALEEVDPAAFTIATVPTLLGSDDPWARLMPPPQRIPDELVEEGRTIPIPRVQAMHEGRRRARARRASAPAPPERTDTDDG